jgi:hypothetical protein
MINGQKHPDHPRRPPPAAAATSKQPLLQMPITTTLYAWDNLAIPGPDFLVGELLSTSSRALFIGPSGVGKTNFLMALAAAMSQGRPFLHWRAGRAARVAYIDGEMGPALAQRRLRDVVRRIGCIDHPNNFHFVCFNQLRHRPPPLNTSAGQQYMNDVIKELEVDFIFLDNIQSLLDGSMMEEAPWQATLPWIHDLTRRRVGQAWAHHTGIDRRRGYGTSTREWQLDTVMLAEADPDQDHVEFKLRFLKARERSPKNRSDFETMLISLEQDQWHSKPAASARLPPRRRSTASGATPSPQARKYHEALLDALSHCGEPRPQSANLPSVTFDEWRGELRRRGLLKDGDTRATASSNRALISKYRQELIAAEWIACNEEIAWSIRGIE